MRRNTEGVPRTTLTRNQNTRRAPVQLKPKIVTRPVVNQSTRYKGTTRKPYSVNEPSDITCDIIPFVKCITDNGDGTFTAFFGYESNCSSVVMIPDGPDNHLFPPNG